jgi:hypothetical protein
VWKTPADGSVEVPMAAGIRLATRFDAPCRTTAGRRLPDSRRIQAMRHPSRRLPTVKINVPTAPGRFG